jgi:TorA maturation chaperone TorD
MFERELSLDLLKELAAEKGPIANPESLREFDEPRLKRGFELMGSYLRAASHRSPNQVKLELDVEYANLFLGVKQKPAHPSESIYLSREQSMYQEPRDRVLSTYWKAGIDKKKEYTEPEDHIAVELQFMENLCRRLVEALQKDEVPEALRYLKLQEEFVNDHLAKWVPRLAADMLESGEVDFYRGVGLMTDAFVAIDREAIPACLKELEDSGLK